MTVSEVSADSNRIGVVQFGNKIYTESELGATHDLRATLRMMLNIRFRNEDYNDVPGALEAAIHMLHTRQATFRLYTCSSNQVFVK